MKQDLSDQGRGETLTITREVLAEAGDQGREGDSPLEKKPLEIKDCKEEAPLWGKKF
jgi:hypothetical protein